MTEAEEIELANCLANRLECQDRKAIVIYVDDDGKISGANPLIVKALRYYVCSLTSQDGVT